MLSKKIVDLLNNQIQKEFHSAYLYLSCANYYDEKGLKGFANWFHVQVKEEVDHALYLRAYLVSNNQNIELFDIEAPKETFNNFKDPLELALKHEEYVTKLIHEIYHAALEEHDYRTKDFITWFVTEQGEEEENCTELIQNYDLFAGTPQGLYQLDKDMGARTYVQSATIAAALTKN